MIDETRRPEFFCPDCATPNMVATPLPEYCDDGSNGCLVAVVHDDSCPWFAALAEDERQQPDPYGVVVHVAEADTPRGRA